MTMLAKPTAIGAACAVTYRATDARGEEAEIRLHLEPAAATLADAWDRLTARFGPIDPRTIEIELREVLPERGALPLLVQLYV